MLKIACVVTDCHTSTCCHTSCVHHHTCRFWRMPTAHTLSVARLGMWPPRMCWRMGTTTVWTGGAWECCCMCCSLAANPSALPRLMTPWWSCAELWMRTGTSSTLPTCLQQPRYGQHDYTCRRVTALRIEVVLCLLTTNRRLYQQGPIYVSQPAVHFLSHTCGAECRERCCVVSTLLYGH